MKKRPLTILMGLLLAIAVAAGIIMYLTLPDRNKNVADVSGPDYSKDTCYYVLQPTNDETFDFAWTKFKLTANTISGTLSHYLGETGSRTGVFTGEIKNYNAADKEHTLEAVWNGKPLTLVFGAVVAKADGVTMDAVSCDELNIIIKSRGPKY